MLSRIHSKWQIWDYFRSYPKGSWDGLKGKVILEAFDPLSLRLMKDHILNGVTDGSRPRHIPGSEVSASWLQDQFMTLSLFGENESWVIHAPDEMPPEAKEMILENDLGLENRTLALAFAQSSPFLKKLAKTEVTHLQVEAPRFWDTPKLVDFLCSLFHLPLPFEAKQYLLQSVEHDFMTLFDVFRLIKLNFPTTAQVTLAQVKDLVGVDQLDQFALATEMGKKAWKPFFERLLSVETDFDRLRGIFAFLQGHLIRLGDAQYLQGKDRFSSYDREIQLLSSGWKMDEVQKLLNQLQRWEISSKRKDFLLPTELRQAGLLAHSGSWFN